MAGQYVFELIFMDKDGSELNQYVVMDEGSISDFSKLRCDLSKCSSEPFQVRYFDDEDLIALDSPTDEEFSEFTRFVKLRASRGMVVKLVLDSKRTETEHMQTNIEHKPSTSTEIGEAQKRNLETKKKKWVVLSSVSEDLLKDEIKGKMKAELKEEILSEMRRQIGATNLLNPMVGDNEDDSDENFHLNPSKIKVKTRCCVKKEKRSDSKAIEERIQKLEMKKMKLLQMANTKNWYTEQMRLPSAILRTNISFPQIMSGIASKSTMVLSKRVTVGKIFVHQWSVTNDGTVHWNNVELRHTWSSPGLEPEELALRCPPLGSGQDDYISIKLRAPKTVGTFISYWHFFHEVDFEWKQFGHFVSVEGHTKPAKTTSHEEQNKCKETIKTKPKGAKTVSFSNDKMCPMGISCEGPTEMGCCIEVAKKHLEASLASAEIAAEMAQEAAKAAMRRVSSGMAKVAEADEMLNKVLQPVADLKVVDSSSETDKNVNNKEETDPGFVIVDMPSPSQTVQNNLIGQGGEVKVTNSAEEEKKMNTLYPDIMADGIVPLEPTHVKMSQAFGVDKLIQNENITLNPLPTEENKTPQPTCVKINRASLIDKWIQNENITLNPLPTEENKTPQPTHVKMSREYLIDKLIQNENIALDPLPTEEIKTAHTNVNLTDKECPNSQPEVRQGPPMATRAGPNINYPSYHPYSAHVPKYPQQYIPPPLQKPLIPNHPYAVYGPHTMYSPYTQPPGPSNIRPHMHFSPHQLPTCLLPMIPSEPVMTHPPLNPPVPQTIEPYQKFSVQQKQSLSNVPPVPIQTKSEENANSKSSTSNSAQENAQATQTTTGFNLTAEKLSSVTETNHDSGTNVTPQEEIKKSYSSAVEILPQALVDGAINVATTAYSTARNALSSLRPREEVKPDFDPLFENNMALLVEMGFLNIARNAQLLEFFKNDLSQVIAHICSNPREDILDFD